jgi:uncharacterized repeat protein (TIGR01451 family)
MFNLSALRFALALAAGLGFAAVAAAQQAQVTSSLQVEKVVTVDAKTVLQPATASKPGDVLEYRVTYDNRGALAVHGLVADLPIPAGTTYIAASAEPAGAQASVDGVHFAPMPLMQMVKQADGSERKLAVPLADYRVLRWTLGTLQGGKQEQLHARVRVNPVASVLRPVAGTAPPAKP